MSDQQREEIDRLLTVARKLTIVGDEYRDRASTFYQRAEEYLAQAASLRREAGK